VDRRAALEEAFASSRPRRVHRRSPDAIQAVTLYPEAAGRVTAVLFRAGQRVDKGAPLLALDEWRDTRDALHNITRMMGAIRGANTPRHPHWWNVALQVGPTGLRTGPVPSGTHNGPFEVDLDLGACTFGIEGGEDLEYLDIDEDVYTVENMGVWAVAQIELFGAKTDPDLSKLDGDFELEIDEDEAEDFIAALTFVHGAFEEFANGIPTGWTSPINFWPHGFDLSVNWFTGNAVPGADAADREASDEQMNFGFSTGDASIDEPYFYMTAHTKQTGLEQAKLPHGARWQTDGFTGFVWTWADMRALKDPRGALLKVLRAAQSAGAELMT